MVCRGSCLPLPGSLALLTLWLFLALSPFGFFFASGLCVSFWAFVLLCFCLFSEKKVFNVSQSSLVCFSDSSDLVSSPPAFVGLATEASSGLPLLSGGLVARLIGIAGKPLCLLLQSFLSTNSWIRRTVVNFLSPIYALTILLISVVRRRVPTVGSRGMARMGSTFFRHS